MDLPIETVKRLLCDCSFATVFEDANGNPLDVGRKQRTVSTSLRRALYASVAARGWVQHGQEGRRDASLRHRRGGTIPPHGYRREDFVDDDAGHERSGEPSAEGFCTTAVRPDVDRAEVRETAPVYRLKRAAAPLDAATLRDNLSA